MVKYDKQKCLYCGGCVSVCPVGALELMETEIKYDPEKCIHCGACIKLCPSGALQKDETEKDKESE